MALPVMSSKMFFELKGQDEMSLHFFSDEESLAISDKILEYLNNPQSRSGGSALQKHIEKAEYFLNGLVTHIDAIKAILEPKERTRKKTADKVKEEMIETIAASWKDMDEKTVRHYASKLIGEDKANDFLVDELPYVIAVYQVRKEIMSFS